MEIGPVRGLGFLQRFGWLIAGLAAPLDAFDGSLTTGITAGGGVGGGVE